MESKSLAQRSHQHRAENRLIFRWFWEEFLLTGGWNKKHVETIKNVLIVKYFIVHWESFCIKRGILIIQCLWLWYGDYEGIFVVGCWKRLRLEMRNSWSFSIYGENNIHSRMLFWTRSYQHLKKFDLIKNETKLCEAHKICLSITFTFQRIREFLWGIHERDIMKLSRKKPIRRQTAAIQKSRHLSLKL